eukprot:1241402-Amphidinium_carterae.1
MKEAWRDLTAAQNMRMVEALTAEQREQRRKGAFHFWLLTVYQDRYFSSGASVGTRDLVRQLITRQIHIDSPSRRTTQMGIMRHKQQ